MLIARWVQLIIIGIAVMTQTILLDDLANVGCVKRNISCSKTEPWGMPYTAGRGAVDLPPRRMDWVQPSRYERIHWSGTPWRSNVISRQCSRMFWSTVSNATVTSNRDTIWVDLEDSRLSWVAMTIGWLNSSRWLITWRWAILSRILDKCRRLETGWVCAWWMKQWWTHIPWRTTLEGGRRDIVLKVTY